MMHIEQMILEAQKNRPQPAPIDFNEYSRKVKAQHQFTVNESRKYDSWPEIRAFVVMRDKYKCQCRCNKCKGILHVHHIKERSEGGTNDLDNLITLCEGCHLGAHGCGGLLD